jgi:hypothetical protein
MRDGSLAGELIRDACVQKFLAAPQPAFRRVSDSSRILAGRRYTNGAPIALTVAA